MRRARRYGGLLPDACCGCREATEGSRLYTSCHACEDAVLDAGRCVGPDGSERGAQCCACAEEVELVAGACVAVWGGRHLAAHCCDCTGARVDTGTGECRVGDQLRPVSCCEA